MYLITKLRIVEICLKTVLQCDAIFGDVSKTIGTRYLRRKQFNYNYPFFEYVYMQHLFPVPAAN
jgi:hypothetical protein